MMIGGDADVVKHLDPIFATLAPGRGDIPRTPGREKVSGTAEQGYLHCGPNGAGHFVKMVHNGIEYGVMAAYAEGLGGPQGRQCRQDRPARSMRKPRRCAIPSTINTISIWPDIAEVWRRGSVIASWLLDLTAAALIQDPALTKFAGRVSDSGEGRWTIKAAIDEGVPAPCALRRRSMSGSARAARRTSPTSCFRPCATSSAGTSRNRREARWIDNGAKRRCSKQS